MLCHMPNINCTTFWPFLVLIHLLLFDFIATFRSFLLTCGLTEIFEEKLIGILTTAIICVAVEHLPESGNINNCQTSATFTKFVQLENGFLSTIILRYCGNKNEKTKLNMFLYTTKQ